MPRPLSCRRVARLPEVTYFKPEGIRLEDLAEVRLSVEEAEAVRLKDLEGKEQEAGAAEMNISRPTFQRVLASARRKMAEALLTGKAIRIEGGTYELAEGHSQMASGTRACPACGFASLQQRSGRCCRKVCPHCRNRMAGG